ncbi:MAG: glycosyltransferase [Candidatus Saccharibacteria bacterium]
MKKTITYIFPIYNESSNIDLLYKTIKDTTTQLLDKYHLQFIFINDGSKDDSLQKLVDIQRSDNSVKVVNFSRNFGHQIAVTAGLDNTSGDAVIIMDSDMQDPPQVSLDLISKWEQGYEVVYAQRKTRKDTFFKRVTAAMFYKTLQNLASIDIPRNTGDFRLIDKKVVKAINSMHEHDRFLRGMVAWVGFKQIAVQFDRGKRHAGETNYSLSKMMKLAMDGILGFSTYPIRLISKVGYFISILAFLGILYAIAYKFINPDNTVPGWTFIVISILFIGGLQLIMLGILGGYIGRIYSEAQNRPLYIIDNIYETKDHDQQAL